VTRVALMQPTFLPWLGYFALADAVDLFVFLDDFQFGRRTFGQRNRLFVAGDRVDWVSVPVAHAGDAGRVTYREARPLTAEVARKLPALLGHAYARAPHLRDVLPLVERWLAGPHGSLADLNMAFCREAMRLFGIRAEVTTSSRIGSRGARSARLESLLRAVSATTYCSARGSVGYMVEDAVFPLDGVETVVQRYEPAPYAQVQSRAFVPYLSALDAMLQLGPDGAADAMRRGARAFEPWEEAIAS